MRRFYYLNLRDQVLCVFQQEKNQKKCKLKSEIPLDGGKIVYVDDQLQTRLRPGYEAELDAHLALPASYNVPFAVIFESNELMLLWASTFKD